MMKMPHGLLLAASLALGMTSAANAYTIVDEGLINSGIAFTIGDKHFDHFFAGTPTVLGNGSITPINATHVYGLVPSNSGELIGIRFGIAGTATNSAFVDEKFSYEVSVIGPLLITGILAKTDLQATGSQIFGSIGVASLTETAVATGDALLLHALQPNGLLSLSTWVPSTRVIKDLQLIAVNGGTAGVNFIDQYFKQNDVPEPGSIALLCAAGMGGFAMLSRRKARK